ncbi:hypothetical protein [Pseudomonas sp. LBUM920]|uniref:hypothetical protein n=1 Tax=Pseudomonas sp. LBUM920 TaxID=2126069 RepID=UPI000F565995|nr:hypothetical protein [Pseudomonas sp. LBUM920]AZF62652.1 hypothetical protein C4J83_1649 [Pseudomonas sp. LBUM920]
MNIDEDTSTWLGCPTPLEMYKHQCALLEDELNETLKRLSDARRNIAGLIQMSDGLTTRLADALSCLSAARIEIDDLRERCSEPSILGIKLVTEQRDYLLRENQRLLAELRAPQERPVMDLTSKAL